MIYFQIFTTFRYKSLKNSDNYEKLLRGRPRGQGRNAPLRAADIYNMRRSLEETTPKNN